MRVALALGLVLPLAGCGWLTETFGFGDDGGLPFRASIDAGEDPRDLVVAVAVPATVALTDFRESARFPVTRTTEGARLQARCTGRA
jgi:hypothetical protein